LLTRIFNPNWWRFQYRYWRGRTPWDTQITPPEVMAFIADTPPGRALDLGCGTGTNAITLARHGWRVTGVDFIAGAIRQARHKTAAAGLAIDFIQASVTDLSILSGPYSYVLDIGCLFGLMEEDRKKYAANLRRLMGPQSWYMLYAWHPRIYKGKVMGISSEEVDRLLGDGFEKIKEALGEERGAATAWYWYRRR
jgi:SAM-dependent methyltransferase